MGFFRSLGLLPFIVPLTLLIGTIVFLSCHGNEQAPRAITGNEQVRNDLTLLEATAVPGDLILREGDDLLSRQIKYLNTKDPSFSHAGLIVLHGGHKMVCDIYPNAKGADTITYSPIDSFANPNRNLSCALYRYDLSGAERNSLQNTIDHFARTKVHFDARYDLSTDDSLYCSEMISKAVARATSQRIRFKETSIPARMRPLIMAYFKHSGASAEMIKDRKYIAPDALYLLPQCKLIMKFPLKYFPAS